jgi:hypothetical protein
MKLSWNKSLIQNSLHAIEKVAINKSTKLWRNFIYLEKRQNKSHLVCQKQRWQD